MRKIGHEETIAWKRNGAAKIAVAHDGDRKEQGCRRQGEHTRYKTLLCHCGLISNIWWRGRDPDLRCYICSGQATKDWLQRGGRSEENILPRVLPNLCSVTVTVTVTVIITITPHSPRAGAVAITPAITFFLSCYSSSNMDSSAEESASKYLDPHGS